MNEILFGTATVFVGMVDSHSLSFDRNIIDKSVEMHFLDCLNDIFWPRQARHESENDLILSRQHRTYYLFHL
jgi:hypothetical protein